jgi:hypothetical protein
MTTPQDVPSASELQAVQSKLTDLEQCNQAELTAIAQLGAQIDPGSLTLIRVNTFVSFVFQRLGTSSPEIRQMLTLLFETEYQEQIAETLKDVKTEVRKQMLAAGPPPSKEQLKEMWRRRQGNGHGSPFGPG